MPDRRGFPTGMAWPIGCLIKDAWRPTIKSGACLKLTSIQHRRKVDQHSGAEPQPRSAGLGSAVASHATEALGDLTYPPATGLLRLTEPRSRELAQATKTFMDRDMKSPDYTDRWELFPVYNHSHPRAASKLSSAAVQLNQTSNPVIVRTPRVPSTPGRARKFRPAPHANRRHATQGYTSPVPFARHSSRRSARLSGGASLDRPTLVRPCCSGLDS